MAKGYGFQVSDWLLLGIVAVGGYFAWKTLGKGISTATEGTGQAVSDISKDTANLYSRGTEALGSYADIFNAGFDKITNSIDKGNNKPLSSTILNISKNDNEIARANTSAMFSGASYNSNTGVLITKEQKGFSVRPEEVPNVIRQSAIKTGIQNINFKTGQQSKLTPSLYTKKK